MLFAKRSSGILMPIIYGVYGEGRRSQRFFKFGELGQEVHRFFLFLQNSRQLREVIW